MAYVAQLLSARELASLNPHQLEVLGHVADAQILELLHNQTTRKQITEKLKEAISSARG